MPRDIGEIDGGYELVHVGEEMEILRTPGGRYSIVSPDLGKTLKSNIVNLEDAIMYLEELEGKAGEEEEIALELGERGMVGFGELLHRKQKISPAYKIGESVPLGKVPQLTYLGGSPKYEVWRSAKGRYTLSRREPPPTIDIKSGLTEEELQKILPKLPSETPYQLELSDLPSATGRSGRVDISSLPRELERERFFAEMERY